MTTVITQEDASAINWYRELTPVEKRTFWACFGGWALDAMDVQIFSFVIPAIIIAFAITNADAGLIGTVTLLTSAFGGWFAGALADRFGRVRTLQITILWFAFFTLLCGFAQNYTQLLVFRALMGFGFGGEWAAGAVLMGEVIRAQHRGKAVGSVQSGWAIGWAVAAAMATLTDDRSARHPAGGGRSRAGGLHRDVRGALLQWHRRGARGVRRDHPRHGARLRHQLGDAGWTALHDPRAESEPDAADHQEAGLLRCEATVVHLGGRTATSEGRIVDRTGKLYAHGTTPASSSTLRADRWSHSRV